MHVEKYKCEKCKRVCKESKYIHIKKPSKETIYKNKKYIEMCINIYKNTYYEHENI